MKLSPMPIGLLVVAVIAALLAGANAADKNASPGAPASSAEADYKSAIEYAYGMNKVQIDDAKVVELLQRAAAQNFPEAEAGLANLTKNGFHGLAKDSAKAEELAQRSLSHGLVARATEGGASAQVALASLYQEGLGGGADATKVAGLLQKAADQGNASAQNALGFLYEKGTGVGEGFQQGRGAIPESSGSGPRLCAEPPCRVVCQWHRSGERLEQRRGAFPTSRGSGPGPGAE